MTITTSISFVLSSSFYLITFLWWSDKEPQILCQGCGISRFLPNWWFSVHFLHFLMWSLILFFDFINFLGVIPFWVNHPATFVCPCAFLLAQIRSLSVCLSSRRLCVLSLLFYDIFDLADRIPFLILNCRFDCFSALHGIYLSYDTLSIVDCMLIHWIAIW